MPQTSQRRYNMSIDWLWPSEVFGDFNKIHFRWVVWGKGSWSSGDYMEHWRNNEDMETTRRSSFICLFINRYLLSTYHISGTVLEAGGWSTRVDVVSSLSWRSYCLFACLPPQPPHSCPENALKCVSPWYTTGHTHPPGASSCFAGSDLDCSIALLSLGHEGADCPL